MKLWFSDDHDSVWVGGASMVLAHDEEEARRLLDEQLVKRGLRPHGERPYTLHKVAQTRPWAIIIRDGDY